MKSELDVNEIKTIKELVLGSPWRNVYWFARILISNDKYGAVGRNSSLMLEVCLGLRRIISDKSIDDPQKIELSRNFLREILKTRFKKKTGRSDRIDLFYNDVSNKFDTVEDIFSFIFAAEHILVPINSAMRDIPNNDREYTEATAKAYLDEIGDKALATVIGFWDDAGVEGCLTAEREAVVRTFTHLRRDISSMPEFELNMVLTAFVQEFERRLGQKRKGRAGGSLEDVTSFLFNYYNIKAENSPEHFQADIEIDRWVRCKDKWLIGISCKRTLRERWKQVSSATAEVLGKFKIRYIWHLVTYDEDLSDDKLALLGGMRHIFYLRDDSRRYLAAKQNVGLKDYVRPMSSFITDLRNEIDPKRT